MASIDCDAEVKGSRDTAGLQGHSLRTVRLSSGGGRAAAPL